MELLNNADAFIGMAVILFILHEWIESKNSEKKI